MSEQVRRSDARDNRQRILAEARLAFAEKGLDVPIREVARRSGLGVATVYRHFRTKEDLFSAAFTDQMARCTQIVEEGLASPDAWAGFREVIEKLFDLHARDQGFARAFTSRLPEAEAFTADRDRNLGLMLELMSRAKKSGRLRNDLVLEDISLALMANEGIRAPTATQKLAASRRLAGLMLLSFENREGQQPLPPPVRLPLSR